VDVSTLLLSSEEQSNAKRVEVAKPDQETQACAEVVTPLPQLGAAIAAPWSEPSVQTAVKVPSSRGLSAHLRNSPQEDKKKKWPPKSVGQELTAQSQRHAQEMDVLRQENAQRLQEVRQEATQAALGAQAMVPAIREMGQALQTALKEAVQDSRKEKDRPCLVDTKGLGKPSVYSGEAEQFLLWRHRMSSYICSVYPDLLEVLEWCEEREKSICSEELSKAFGDEADALDQVSNLAEKSSELASALQMVTRKKPSPS